MAQRIAQASIPDQVPVVLRPAIRAPSQELRTFALDLRELQEFRHRADYDLFERVPKFAASDAVARAADAIERWSRLRDRDEARAFLLACLLWRNLERR